MAYAKLSTAECHAIKIARDYAPTDARRAMKREVFARAKVQFGIPANHKLVAEVDVDSGADNAGVLKNKSTREAYTLDDQGKWIHAAATGAAGAAAAKRWYQVPVERLHEALIDMLDNMDAAGNDDIVASESAPNAATTIAIEGEQMIIDVMGNAWVLASKDAYEIEGDDDLPY
jgi:hypothetical protein